MDKLCMLRGTVVTQLVAIIACLLMLSGIIIVGKCCQIANIARPMLGCVSARYSQSRRCPGKPKTAILLYDDLFVPLEKIGGRARLASCAFFGGQVEGLVLIPDALWNMQAGQHVFMKRIPHLYAINFVWITNGVLGVVFYRNVGTMDAAHSYLTDDDLPCCGALYGGISFADVFRCGLEKFDLSSDETS